MQSSDMGMISAPRLSVAVPDSVREMRRITNSVLIAIAALFVVATVQTKFNPFVIFFKSENFFEFVVKDLLPPYFTAVTGLGEAIWQTIGMSMIATFFGGTAAFVLCFFASYQTAPHRAIVKVMRAFASIQRNIPSVVWLFILVVGFGIGTAIGTMALFISTFGLLLRAFADVVDESSVDSMEALDSVGAGFLSKLFQSVIPEAAPGFISWLLYALEVNIRSSAVIGACGGGGIGLVMMSYLRSFRYHSGFGIILILALLTITVNAITDYLRKKVLA